MKYSYNWLKELSGTKKNPNELAELLTMHSFEVEGVERLNKGLENVVVGKVLEVKQHPNADKLKLTKVEVGEGKVLDIVCGAPNVSENQKVPVALPGAKLPGMSAQGGSASGGEIKESDIRGEKSSGMICAEDELGIGESHEGIMVLSEEEEIGTSFSDVIKMNDSVIDIDILSNRGHDALSHLGVAREISTLEGSELDYDYEGLNLNQKETGDFTVEIKNKKCTRYIGTLIKGVEVKESPQWIKSRLLASGIRPINNIVDATNYVMLELGQPLHAFSAKGGPVSGWDGKKIIVRSAVKSEKINLLDGSEKELTEEDLVIADESKPLALAGVMGGELSGVSNDTTDILLEAANFNATSIRKTRIRHFIKTDSSDRFEKEIDPNLAEKATVRLVEIIQHIAGGEIVGTNDVYPDKITPWSLELNLNYIKKLLGERVPANSVENILKGLGIKVLNKSDDSFELEIPTFRIDLKNQEDLIEEIGRIYGYEEIEEKPLLAPIKSVEISEMKQFERKLKTVFVGNGFAEVYNYSFYSQKDANLAQLGIIKHLELANPMNPDQQLMRVSMGPNILKNVKENLKNFKDFRIFEIGRVYWPVRNAEDFTKSGIGNIGKNEKYAETTDDIVAGGPNGEVLPEEKKILAGAIVLEEDKKAESFYLMKGILDNVFDIIGVKDYYFDDFDPTSKEELQTLWHGGRVAEIKIEGANESFGIFGEINPLILTDFDIHKRVVMFEFDLEKFLQVVKSEREYRPIRKHPEVTRDISMIANSGVKVNDILTSIQFAGGDLVLDVDLFDIFDIEEEGNTSFAFHIIFGAEDRTLTNEEVDILMNKIISSLEEELKVKIRK